MNTLYINGVCACSCTNVLGSQLPVLHWEGWVKTGLAQKQNLLQQTNKPEHTTEITTHAVNFTR